MMKYSFNQIMLIIMQIIADHNENSDHHKISPPRYFWSN